MEGNISRQDALQDSFLLFTNDNFSRAGCGGDNLISESCENSRSAFACDGDAVVHEILCLACALFLVEGKYVAVGDLAQVRAAERGSETYLVKSR